MRKFRKAFSLVELIIVIVVIGILATMTTQRLKRDNKNEAMTKLLTMIRYTRSLALHDDKQLRDNPKWQRRFWRFEVKNCATSGIGVIYSIGSNEEMSNLGHISFDDSAVDPSNGKFLYSSCLPAILTDQRVSPNVFLSKKFGIKDLNFNTCRIFKTNNNNHSSAKHIAFDKFGRIYKSNLTSNTPDYSGYALSDCKITVSFQNNNISPFHIIINKETGFAYIQEYPNL